MSEDVQGHMHVIQEKEIDQLRDLTAFLDLEIGFVEQYLNVLKEVKEGWYDESSVVQIPPRRASGALHVFARPNSVQSRVSNRSHAKDPSDSDDEDKAVSRTQRSMSVSSKPTSRPASRASRKRADSAATVAGEEKASKRISVAGWASSAVESVTGRNKKSKDKDKFATLNDDEEDQPDATDEIGVRTSPKKPSSFHSLSRKLSSKSDKSLTGSPKPGAKILKPLSLQGRKTVRAVHSFSGGADELTFSAGDEIVVVNEVLEGWWMGELYGKKGLFPTTYVETTSPKPPLPKRRGASRSNEIITPSSSLSEGAAHGSLDDDESDSYLSTDADDDEDFSKRPLSAHHSSPFFSTPSETASITSSLAENFDDKLQVPFSRNTHFDTGFDDDADGAYFRSVPVSRASPVPPERKVLQSLNSLPSPPQIARRTTTEPALIHHAAAPAKKAPPPPPPRRLTNGAGGFGPTPPIPERLYKSNSLPLGGQLKVPTPASSISSHDRSPFDSVTDLSAPSAVGGCGDFRQNPFQAEGMCSNCFQHHG
ncbi:hypothetical protein DXG03_001381 [Asterophora parasitica]|uniref:SH3 domain-containing protein n=1 Tax=Asterophora parasitica TaxID=117018 RepID=A0A9P7G9K9_9AGAR|nr:hypothetical protein DXG03_001381 [Asterophora parasitica]